MSVLVFSPFLRRAPAIDLGNRTWSKRLLPVGDVLYKGRVLHFSPAYLADLARAFEDGAYDQVPFQIAPGDNSHSNDPERCRGWITAMSAEPDGLWVTAEVTEAGQRLLEANPGLGVSARIVEQYQRSDGKYYGQAIQHVLGTLDPRIPGLGPWQQADLSNDGDAPQVIDLSGLAYEGDEPGPDDGLPDDDELAELLDGMSADEVAEITAYIDGLSDDELEALADHAEIYQDLTPEDAAAFGELQAEQYSNDGGGYGLANGYGGDVMLTAGVENASRAFDFAVAQAEVRASYDRARPLRTTEQRLDLAYQRIALGVFTPDSALDFSGSAAARELARMRWQQAQGDPLICGTPDFYGRCSARFHEQGCSSDATTDIALSYRQDGTYDATAAAPFEDSRGMTWASQHGEPMSLMDHLEASLGLRLGDGPWSTGQPRRETLVAQKQMVWGDPDGDEVPGGMPLESRASALVAALDLGLDSTDAASERQRYRERRDSALAALAMRSGFRPGHPDYQGETPAQRSNRVRASAPLVLRPVIADEDLLPGEPQALTYG